MGSKWQGFGEINGQMALWGWRKGGKHMKRGSHKLAVRLAEPHKTPAGSQGSLPMGACDVSACEQVGGCGPVYEVKPLGGSAKDPSWFLSSTSDISGLRMFVGKGSLLLAVASAHNPLAFFRYRLRGNRWKLVSAHRSKWQSIDKRGVARCSREIRAMGKKVAFGQFALLPAEPQNPEPLGGEYFLATVETKAPSRAQPATFPFRCPYPDGCHSASRGLSDPTVTKYVSLARISATGSPRWQRRLPLRFPEKRAVFPRLHLQWRGTKLMLNGIPVPKVAGEQMAPRELPILGEVHRWVQGPPPKLRALHYDFASGRGLAVVGEHLREFDSTGAALGPEGKLPDSFGHEFKQIALLGGRWIAITPGGQGLLMLTGPQRGKAVALASSLELARTRRWVQLLRPLGRPPQVMAGDWVGGKLVLQRARLEPGVKGRYQWEAWQALTAEGASENAASPSAQRQPNSETHLRPTIYPLGQGYVVLTEATNRHGPSFWLRNTGEWGTFKRGSNEPLEKLKVQLPSGAAQGPKNDPARYPDWHHLRPPPLRTALGLGARESSAAPEGCSASLELATSRKIYLCEPNPAQTPAQGLELRLWRGDK